MLFPSVKREGTGMKSSTAGEHFLADGVKQVARASGL
jgi:hypothetical protein